jgi:hypothetical protein
MTTGPDKPQSQEGKTPDADVDSALDALFAEATKLLQEMKSFLRRQRAQDSK